ncbi:MAG: hypothetical protein IPL33_19880 [Sphingobacteriales bacterium]|nr:hypothetical protein [Sphingobacteriales bacterium]
MTVLCSEIRHCAKRQNVGGDYANFSNQTRKAAKPSVASEISAHQVKREIAEGSWNFQVKWFSAS